MLRRRLLSRVGFLICAFVVGAVVAVSMLQGVLADIDAVNKDATALTDWVQEAVAAAIAVERRVASPEATTLTEMDGGDPHARLRGWLDRLGEHHAVSDPGSPASLVFLKARERAAALAASPSDPRAMTALHTALADLGREVRHHVAAEQRRVGEYFRKLVLGLTIAAMVIMNLAILVLLYTAQMVLKPVGALVEGSRLLAAEQFGHRVVINEQDEFGELAHAYNYLASQLQSSEEQKAEALRQLAVTLNHGLNNAMSIIELQLGLLDRQSGANPGQASHLREIRTSLAHMSGIVASLKDIRRVVLTDYLPGQKMVDLERSVSSEPPASAGASS